MIDLKKYVKKDNKLILAVSGGVDSVVLLDMISKVHPKENLIIVHIDHGLRKESREDEEFVRNLAQKYDICYKSTHLDLKKTDENTAREARYNYLNKIRREFGAKYIVTAHHLDDQAETVFLNLARGTGPLRMWGMNTLMGDIFRPLLDVSKQEILEYAKNNKLEYVEDVTNLDINYKRNLIRHKVIPELKKINPNFLKNLENNRKLMGELSSFVDSEVAKLMGEELNIKKLKEAHPYIAKEAIKKKLHELVGSESDIYKKNILEVYSLLEKSGTKRTEIGSLVVEKDYESIKFGKKFQKIEKSKKLEPGEEIDFNGYKLKNYFGKGESSKNNILIAEDFEYTLRVRSWEKGDKIKTISGTKKLQDIFTDAKISQDERKMWPIIVSGEEIIWVPKLAASIHAKNCSENKCLIIEVK